MADAMPRADVDEVLGSTRLRPRPLYDGEPPAAGVLHFAVGFGKGSALVSRVIVAGTASRTNHVGVITQAEPDRWVLVEALAGGVQVHTHRPPPVSTVIRLSDDPRYAPASHTQRWPAKAHDTSVTTTPPSPGSCSSASSGASRSSLSRSS